MNEIVAFVLVFIAGFVAGGTACIGGIKSKMKKGMAPFIAKDDTLQWRDL